MTFSATPADAGCGDARPAPCGTCQAGEPSPARPPAVPNAMRGRRGRLPGRGHPPKGMGWAPSSRSSNSAGFPRRVAVPAAATGTPPDGSGPGGGAGRRFSAPAVPGPVGAVSVHQGPDGVGAAELLGQQPEAGPSDQHPPPGAGLRGSTRPGFPAPHTPPVGTARWRR